MKPTFAQAMQESRARLRVRDDLAASTPRALLMNCREYGSVLVHPDCFNVGGWRVTRFFDRDEPNTPTGHAELPTFEKAVLEAHWDNPDYSTVRAVSPSTV